MSSKPLEGRVSVVTGGGSGFGLAIAQSCADAGSDVALLDIDIQAAQLAAAAIAADTGVATVACAVDVGDTGSVVDAAAAVEDSVGSCNLLFANVGVQQFGAIERLTDEDWAWLLNVNVLGTVRTVREFLPQIRRSSGFRHVTLTASSSVLSPGVRLGAYQASKFAVAGIGETLRLELAAEEIGVTLLYPAGMLTRHLESSADARPDELGPSVTLPDDIEAMLASRPLDPSDLSTPEHAARNVVRDILADQPYVITHGSYRSHVEDWSQSIARAFDRMEED